jgi:hypothetical protein
MVIGNAKSVKRIEVRGQERVSVRVRKSKPITMEN